MAAAVAGEVASLTPVVGGANPNSCGGRAAKRAECHPLCIFRRVPQASGEKCLMDFGLLWANNTLQTVVRFLRLLRVPLALWATPEER